MEQERGKYNKERGIYNKEREKGTSAVSRSLYFSDHFSVVYYTWYPTPCQILIPPYNYPPCNYPLITSHFAYFYTILHGFLLILLIYYLLFVYIMNF